MQNGMKAPAETAPLILVACGSRRLAQNTIKGEGKTMPQHPRLRYAVGPSNLRAMPRGTLLVDLTEAGQAIAGCSSVEAEEMRQIIQARAYTVVRLADLAAELARLD